MSNTTLVLGLSGSGKSTSLRNLNSEETFIINVLNKPLPFKGYKANYKLIKLTPNDDDANADNGGNYYATDDYAKILNVIKHINLYRPEIKILVLDDFQYLMCNEFMRRVGEKGFEKFNDLALHAWSVITSLTLTRDDLFCFVLTHSDADQNGVMKFKTIGRMLEDKVTLEGMFTCILHSLVQEGEFKFLTQYNGQCIAKSPLGMFDELFIDNDLKTVIEAMKEYANE